MVASTDYKGSRAPLLSGPESFPKPDSPPPQLLPGRPRSPKPKALNPGYPKAPKHLSRSNRGFLNQPARQLSNRGRHNQHSNPVWVQIYTIQVFRSLRICTKPRGSCRCLQAAHDGEMASGSPAKTARCCRNGCRGITCWLLVGDAESRGQVTGI